MVSCGSRMSFLLLFSNRTVYRIPTSLQRRYFITRGNSLLENVKNKELLSQGKEKALQIYSKYEKFIGYADVKAAQERVLKAEQEFITIQQLRRDASKDLGVMEEQLKSIRKEVDRATRGEQQYIQLLTQEYNVLREESQLRDHFNQLERKERDSFTILSNALRSNHEQERLQGERTKYFSIIGSIIGAVVGIIGTAINNRRKMAEIRSLVVQASESNGVLPENLESIVQSSVSENVTKVFSGLQGTVEKLHKSNLVSLTDIQQVQLHTEEVLNVVQKQMSLLENQNHPGKVTVLSSDGSLVQVEEIIDRKTEEIKLLLFATVTVTIVIAVASRLF